MANYLETDAGKLATASYRYLCAAKTIFEHTDRPKLMLAPVLHLSAHGLETLLKSSLSFQGVEARELRAIGHDIIRMWTDPRCALVREAALAWSETAHETAASLGKLYGPGTDNPREMLERIVADVSKLHSKQPHPLRYLHGEELVPPPHLLIFSLEPVAYKMLWYPEALVATLPEPPSDKTTGQPE